MQANIKEGRKVMGRLAKGDDLLAALQKVCADLDIKLGEVRAIGAVSMARVGYYHQADRKYMFIDLKRPLEILSLVGNISLKDDKPFVHAHVALSDQDGHTFGGHLAEGTAVFACEFVIQEYHAASAFRRHFDEETGLPLWPADQS